MAYVQSTLSPQAFETDFSKTLRSFHADRNATLSTGKVFLLDGHQKSLYLSPDETRVSEGRAILKTLELLDPERASRIGVRDNAVRSFLLRLLSSGNIAQGSESASLRSSHSFIVLSYCCYSSEWTTHPCLQSSSNDASQLLSSIMWQALHEQKSSPHEAIWIDQLCIDQQDGPQKTSAIGSMDLVYQSARVVVVAIEDVAITQDQYTRLLEWTQHISKERIWRAGEALPDLSDPEDLVDAVGTIFRDIFKARWFKRAWCLHEFLVGLNHVFLVPVVPDIWTSSVTVISMDGVLLLQMYVQWMAKEAKGSSQVPEYARTIEADVMRRYADRLTAAQLHQAFGTPASADESSYMLLFQDVMSRGSTVMADKVSILFNALHSGLYLRSTAASSEAGECWRLIGVVALAARDATVLTCSGKSIAEAYGCNQSASFNWLRLPSVSDRRRVKGSSTLPPLVGHFELLPEGLELDLAFIGTSLEAHEPASYFRPIAEWIVDNRSLRIPFDADELYLDIEASQETTSILREVYVNVLVALLEAGKEWALETYRSTYFGGSMPFEVSWSPKLLQGFEQALEWAFEWAVHMNCDEVNDAITIFENNQVYDVNGNAQAGQEQSLDDLVLANDDGEDISYADEDFQEARNVHLILKLVEHAVDVGLAAVHANLEKPRRAPRVLRKGDDLPLLLLGACDERRDYQICVPSSLLHGDFAMMPRVWLVEVVPESIGGKRHVRILDKSRGYGLALPASRSEERMVVIG